IGYTSTAQLMLALGGTTRGDQYDAIESSGSLSLGGTLVVSLINGFVPAAGNSFDILDWGTLNGTFANGQLPALLGGLKWNTTQPYTTGTLSITGCVGDYNYKGVVDAADYVVWRKMLGKTGPALGADGNNDGVANQPDSDIWRAHFGQTAGSGSGVGTNAAVP